MLAVTLPKTVTGEVCQVLLWQIMTISENRLEDLLTDLDADHMAEVEWALRVLWRLT